MMKGHVGQIFPFENTLKEYVCAGENTQGEEGDSMPWHIKVVLKPNICINHCRRHGGIRDQMYWSERDCSSRCIGSLHD